MEAAEIEKLAALEADHWWYAARRKLLAQAVRGLPPGRALDVGAGAGGNTDVLRAAGWSATAVELSETGSAIARRRGLPIVRADATVLPFSSASVDLVVSMDLWEHIVDDAEAAAEAFRVLKPGGHMFLAVPCGMTLWSDHDEAVGHVRRYERSDLTSLVSGAGFRLDRLAAWNVLLRPVVKLRRGSSGSQESDLRRLPKPLNYALRGIVELERRLHLGKLPGVTLIAQATKPS